jgi:putative glutathione S-transferase
MSEEVKVRPRPKEIENEIDEKGGFVRQPNRFTTPFGEGEGELKAEAGRYRLVWAKGCNWSNRAAIVRELLGLEEAISVNIVDQEDTEPPLGWQFYHEENHLDPILNVRYLSELYANADPEYTGRATVPSLIDVQKKKVVNNDYHKLTNYFEVNFKPFQKKEAPELYPVQLRKEIDEFNEWLFHNINNGVYKMMFAQSIEAYNDAFDHFYAGLDKLEERLETNRFLFGDYVTDSDVRFFVTLARFDCSYYRNLGPLKQRIVDYKNIWAYARDLYEIPAFKNNTYFRYLAHTNKVGKRIFQSYNARFWEQIDYEGIWSQPQNRKELSATPEQKFLIE